MLKAEEFWQYSLRVYGLEAVKQQCLWLQNQYSLNVNMVLLCGFLTEHKIYVGTETFRKLDQQIEKIDQQLKVLRNQRQAYKSEDKTYYRSLLDQELVLEKSQQARLIMGLNNLSSQSTGFNQQVKDNFISYYLSLETGKKQILKDMMTTKTMIMGLLIRK